MDIIDGLSWHQYQDFRPDKGGDLSPPQSDLSQPQQLNRLALEQSKQPTDESEVNINRAYLDKLVEDRWVFKFRFGENQEIIAEIVDSETGDVIKQLYLGQTSPNSIGELLHIKI